MSDSLVGSVSVRRVDTEPLANWARPARPIPDAGGVSTDGATAMRGWCGNGRSDDSSSNGGRGGLPRARGAVRTGAGDPLLPLPRFRGRRAGRAAGDAARRVARAWWLRGAIFDPDVAVPSGDEPVPERLALPEATPARAGSAARLPSTRADPAGRRRMARAVSRHAPRRAAGRHAGPRRTLRDA